MLIRRRTRNKIAAVVEYEKFFNDGGDGEFYSRWLFLFSTGRSEFPDKCEERQVHRNHDSADGYAQKSN